MDEKQDYSVRTLSVRSSRCSSIGLPTEKITATIKTMRIEIIIIIIIIIIIVIIIIIEVRIVISTTSVQPVNQPI